MKRLRRIGQLWWLYCGGGRRSRSKEKNSSVMWHRSACRFASRQAVWAGAEAAGSGAGNACTTSASWAAFLTVVAWKTNCCALRSSVIEMTGNNNQIRHASATRAVIRRRFSGNDRARAPHRSSKATATISHAILSASSTLKRHTCLARLQGTKDT